MTDRFYDRQTEKQYYDTVYEVYRNGGNPDSVDRDTTNGDFWDGVTPDEAAIRYLRRNTNQSDYEN